MTEFGTEQAYAHEYDNFMALPEDKVSHNTQPMEVATAEARELAVAAEEDRAVLLSMGLAPEILDSLMIRVQALAYAVSKYNATLGGDPLALAKWKEMYPQGYELRKYLMRFMTFAYRKDAILSKRMDNIRKGRGHRDMIQDLLDLHVLAKDHPLPLKEIAAFDFDKVTEAMDMNTALGVILARASVDPKVVETTRDIMNRAWTWYKMAADEVKETGQFAFEGTDRYNNYVSEFHQKSGRKSAKLALVKDIPEPEVSETEVI